MPLRRGLKPGRSRPKIALRGEHRSIYPKFITNDHALRYNARTIPACRCGNRTGEGLPILDVLHFSNRYILFYNHPQLSIVEDV